MKKKETIKDFNKDNTYSLSEAIELLPKLSTSKFVGSIAMDIIFDVAEKNKKTTIAGGISLPNSMGGSKKVIAFATGDNAKLAQSAGASEVGLEDLVKKVEDGKVEFDVVVATPDVMSKIAKLGRILGPKGLMPNPTNGTISANIESAVKEFIAGKVNFKKNDQQAIKAKVAKLDQTPEEIEANIIAFTKSVYREAKKIGVQPFKKITLSPTMGAGVKLNISKLMEQIA